MKKSIFTQVLTNRVNAYFIENQISKKGNRELYIKTIFWLTLWFGIFFLLYSFVSFIPAWLKLSVLPILLGLCSAGIGFNIMHDASHKAYSEKKELNTLFAFTLELVGPSSFLWFTKHVTTHHTYVNTDYDDDIETGGLIRMSPHQPHKWFHRYQHIYAWYLYGLLAFQWIYYADYKKLFLGKIHKTNLPEMKTKDMIIFVSAKICNLVCFIIIPVFLYGPSALLAWAIYLFSVGLIISIVFQLAHVHEHAHFEKTDGDGKLTKNWYEHQVYETLDFATNNKTLSWFLGGLNFQVEHHLFPQVSHVHYKAIQPIVKETCREFNLPYKEVSLWDALKSHYAHLKKMGQ
jgi:linoleoyl-CoA desaturase